MTRHHTTHSLVILFAAISGFCSASESVYKQRVADGLTQFENTNRQHWAYKVTRFEDEEGDVSSSIEWFNPELEQGRRWTLLQQNGELPTDRQVERFNRQKQDAKGERNFAIKLRELIREDTLVLKSENRDEFVMGFDVSIEQLGKDAEQNLAGLLRFSKRNNFIESIEVTNTEPFSPMFMVSISTFTLTIRFQKIDDAVLPLENRMRMQGKMSFITEIDEYSVDTFSEFMYRGPLQDVAGD